MRGSSAGRCNCLLDELIAKCGSCRSVSQENGQDPALQDPLSPARSRLPGISGAAQAGRRPLGATALQMAVPRSRACVTRLEGDFQQTYPTNLPLRALPGELVRQEHMGRGNLIRRFRKEKMAVLSVSIRSYLPEFSIKLSRFDGGSAGVSGCE